jgi:DNA-binding NarL/FixJ family response regulator
MIHILIVDDHPVFRYGLSTLFQAEPTFVVVGEATTGQEAVDLALLLAPEVVLMDLNLPDLNGIEATRRILARSPQTSILVLTMLEDDSSVFAALRAGARGYILKGAGGDEMIRAITAVSQGEGIFSPTIAARLIHHFGDPRPQLPLFPELTEREREVLILIAQGLTNNAIADRLILSSKTVRNHVSVIFAKLQVSGRAEAIVKAKDAGMV